MSESPIVAVVGTTNHLKISAARKAFAELLGDVQVLGVEVSTGVSGQPWDGELFSGAKNRATSAIKSKNADFGVGIEAGIVNMNGRTMNTACAVIVNQECVEHSGYSVMFEVPRGILDLVNGGMELSKAVDMYTGNRDSGHDKGLIGILSRGNFVRERMLYEATLMALMEFLDI
jgi:inosine/xanthosine triphosphatase